MIYSTSDNNFWDSCVLASHLDGTQPNFAGDIQRMLDEARSGRRRIWYSTLLYAELRPSLLRNSRFSSIDELIEDMEGVLLPVTPNAEITRMAGRIRDRTFMHHSPQATEKPKSLSVPDAIQLSTAIFIRDAMLISDIEFHTFDDGKSRTHGENCVSLLRLEEYCGLHVDDADVMAACNLPRLRPRLRQQNLA